MSKVSAVLECRQLSKKFSLPASELTILREINLSVQSGEMVAIMGASGAGKSTLLQLLGGLDKPTSGEVLLMGEPYSVLTEKQKNTIRNSMLGFVYQRHHLLAEFNALENVMMPLLIQSSEKQKEIKQSALALLTAVGLADRAEHRVAELSGGERQRVAIARALVAKPACVLADEPTGNLDKESADRVFSLMMSLCQELGTGFVVVTHNPELAANMHRTLLLQDGVLQHQHNND